MKGKIPRIVGLAIIGLLSFALIKTIYKSTFAEEEVTILKSAPIASPIKNAISWCEEEPEKTLPGVGHVVSSEECHKVKQQYMFCKSS